VFGPWAGHRKINAPIATQARDLSFEENAGLLACIFYFVYPISICRNVTQARISPFTFHVSRLLFLPGFLNWQKRSVLVLLLGELICIRTKGIINNFRFYFRPVFGKKLFRPRLRYNISRNIP